MEIRMLRHDDAVGLLEFETANRAWFERNIASRGDAFYSPAGVAEHIASYLEQYRQGRLHPQVLVDGDGAIIGRSNLREIDRALGSAEVGYRIGHDQVGKGLASAALAHMKRLARDAWGLDELHAYILADNLASIRVVQKNRFVRSTRAPVPTELLRGELSSDLYICRLSDG